MEVGIVETKFTKGEWEWRDSKTCEGKNVQLLEGGDDRNVLYHYAAWPVSDADMALIAAAPELFEACQDLIAQVDQGHDAFDTTMSPSVKAAFEKAKAALVKARGE